MARREGNAGATSLVGILLAVSILALSMVPATALLGRGARAAGGEAQRLLAVGVTLSLVEYYRAHPDLALALDGAENLLDGARRPPPLEALSAAERRALEDGTAIHLSCECAPGGLDDLALIEARVQWKGPRGPRSFRVAQLVKLD